MNLKKLLNIRILPVLASPKVAPLLQIWEQARERKHEILDECAWVGQRG